MKHATPTKPSTVTPNLWEEESARAYGTRKAYPCHPNLEQGFGVFEFSILLCVFALSLFVFATLAF